MNKFASTEAGLVPFVWFLLNVVTRGPSAVNEDVQTPLLRDMLKNGLSQRRSTDVS